MKANNLLKFIFILPTIVLLSVSSAANSIETTDGIEVEGDITERTTESEVEFITKTVVEEKVFTNKSQEDNEETTTHETVDYEVNEVNRGLVDNLLKGPTDEELPKNSSSERVYNYLWKLLSDEMRKEVDKYMPQMHEYIFVMNELVSQKCFLSLMRLANRGQKGEPRALKILDSSAKLVFNGLTDGTFTDLGNYDQCIRDFIPSTEDEKQLNGKYCLLQIKPPLPQRRPHLKHSDRIFNFTDTSLQNPNAEYYGSLAHSLYSNPFYLGICIPSECEAIDITTMLNHSMSKFQFEPHIGSDCYVGDVQKYNIKKLVQKLDFYSIMSISIISGMCALIGLATICEFVYNLFHDKVADNERPLIMSFSLISNVKKLYSLKCPPNEEHLQSINGIKIIAIIWVVVGNVYLVGYQPQLRSFIKSVQIELSRRGGCLPYQLILNSWDSSHIFFLIGGLLTAYTTSVYAIRCNGRVNLVKYVAKRLIRLLPPIVLPILLMSLMPLLPNGGPVYNSSTTRMRDNCAQNWWKNLLFISNLLDPNDTCLPHLWFISAYFQLNLIAIIVLFITYKRPKMFNLFAITLILIGVIFPMLNTYGNKLSLKSPFIDRPLLDEIPNDLRLKHFLPFNHFSSFFIGISIGVNLSSVQTKANFNTFIRLTLWFVLPIISLLSICITFLWNNMTASEPSVTLSMFYNGFSRIAFISAFAWVLNECLNKRGGLINKLLSNKQLLPLNRLTYQIYLLNLIVIWFYYFTKRELIVYRDIELLFTSCGVLVLTIIISIFGYLVFEAPFINLSKRISIVDVKQNDPETKPKTKVNNVTSSVCIKLENVEINGNTINGDKYGLNEENINIRL